MKAWRIIRLAALGLLALTALSVMLQLYFLDPTGSYAVGRTTLRWQDKTRPEAMTSQPDDFREVVAEVWYPAEPGTGTPVDYFPNLDRVAQNLVESGAIAPFELMGLRLIRSRSLWNAQISGAQAAYPIILLSPGNETNAQFYAGIAGELASHGYIVVGINHPYDVGAVELADGRVAQFDDGHWPSEIGERHPFVVERIAVRTQDVRFVLDQLEMLNTDGGGDFAGRMDLARVGAMGHSLGGIAASEACRADPRFQACLNLDGLQPGGPFSAVANTEAPNQPFMFITKESVLPDRDIAQLKSIPSGSYWVVIYAASHESFTDAPALMPSLLPIPNEADLTLDLIRTYTLAFFNQTLKKQSINLLAQRLQNQDVLLEVYSPH